MKKGFTLIELLVVISIIGVLSAIVLTSLNTSRAKARDARRVHDITQIQRAIELYINANGHAPDLGDPGCLVTSYTSNINCFAVETQEDNWNTLQNQLSPYLARLPRDPCGEGCYNTRINQYRNNGFFAYYYAAPGMLGSNGFLHENTSIPHSTQTYRIYAQNTETGPSGFGFGPGSFLGSYSY